MSFKIILKENTIEVEYSSYGSGDYFYNTLIDGDEIRIYRTFYILNKDIINFDSYSEYEFDDFTFKIAEKKNEYFVIPKRILDTQYDVLIFKDYRVSKKTFVVNNNISILKKFEYLANQQIIIGGDKETAIPSKVFQSIVNSFPTRREINYYRNSRITNVLTQYLEGVKDEGIAFDNYLNNRIKIEFHSTISSTYEYELEKYKFILEKLECMLTNSDVYSENDWQEEILKIILILFPKYVHCLSNVNIKDYYSNPNKSSNRYIDLLLVDSNGNVDPIEIKKPFNQCLVLKNVYRNNHSPKKELSGTVMQIEKYIFHLNKWGFRGENALNKKYKNELPVNLKIQIINPKGLMIIGREKNLSSNQLFDFEIIKRKYSNILDIITYDDLIKRLENLIYKFTNIK